MNIACVLENVNKPAAAIVVQLTTPNKNFWRELTGCRGVWTPRSFDAHRRPAVSCRWTRLSGIVHQGRVHPMGGWRPLRHWNL